MALLGVCVPTFDLKNGRAEALLESIAYNTSVTWMPHVADGRGQLYIDGVLRAYTWRQNLAMAMGTEDLLLAVNDDVTVSPGWFEPLQAAIEDGAWCATPDMTHSDGPQILAPYCMLWRREAWLEMGGLDEQFVHWCSDLDIARRLVEVGHPPVRVKLPNVVYHELNATSAEQPTLGPVCAADLDRFQAKWGIAAEEEKHRLAALVAA